MVLMTVYVAPPLVGGPDTYTIIQNPTAAQQAQMKAEGYPSFATLAQAEAFVKSKNGQFTLSTNPLKAIIQLATGNATASGQSKSAVSDLAAGSSSTCVIKIPYLNACILTKTEARAMIAGLIIGASGIVMFVGLALLTASALEKTGAGHAAGGALEVAGASLAVVPGLEGAGLAVGAAGSAARRSGSRSGAAQSLQRRRTARTQRQQAGQDNDGV